MFFFTYTAAVLAIIFVSTAVLLYFRGKKDTLTRIFILYILANAVWLGGNAMADISKNDSLLIISSGIGFIGSSFIVTFFLIFVDTFVDGKLPSTTRLIAYFLPSALFTIFSFSEYAVLETIYPPDQPAQIVPGIQYYFFLLFLFAGLTYVLFRLVLLYKVSSGKRRLQTLYISIGFVSLFLGGVTFGVILPLLGELRFFNLAPQFTVILIISTGYAILRHNLLDIRIVIQRGFIYSVLFFSIVSFYLAIINLTGIVLGQITQTTIIVHAGLTTLLGIFTVPYIDRYLRRKTDQFFFKDTYNYADALYTLSEEVNKSVLIEDIQQLTEKALCKILKTDTVTTNFVSRSEIPRILEEIRNHPNKTTVLIPIIFNETVIGTIFVGEKKSGDSFTSEDVVLIKTFSYQIALAFEKARLFKEVQDHSLELEKKVAERTQQIQKMQEQQTQMMLDISHKLQNPLTIVKTELELLRKQMPWKNEFSFFEKTIDDISLFIYDLLHLARFEVVEHHSKQRHNLSDHLHELLEYFETIAAQSSIVLRGRIDPDVYFVYNKKEITELLTNLVSNSIKYMGNANGGKREIKVSLEQSSEKIVLIVEDTGIGIDETELPFVFDRFYRADTASQTSIKGTGLGLAISKKIVEVHNGSISVKSTKGSGTAFISAFPKN